MVKKSLFLILLCIPILSGCKCSKHHHEKHQYNEHKKTECGNPPPSCVHRHEALVTPYPGPLVSNDCPKESVGHYSKHHKRYHKKHHKSHDMTEALPPKYLQVKDFKECLGTEQVSTYTQYCMPEHKPEHCPLDSWQQLVKLALPKCKA
ncbi:MAG TPA: hypothetical protein LFV66_04295 [Rickettsia endosymbiont of Bembidion lapponicum]|nr:hypothetical protein [Rickettsia endosymbiont of Bembidion lapponicum]